MTTEFSKRDTIKIKGLVAEAAASTKARNFLAQDIKNTTTNVANALENFKLVHAKLLGIDRMNIVRERFAPRWKILYDDFYDILEKSRILALDVSALGLKFIGSLNKAIRMKNVPPRSRAKLASNAVKATLKFEQRSVEIEKELDTIDAKLTGMIWLLNPSRFGGQEEGKLTKNMGLVRARIETIKVELQGYDEEMARLANSLSITPIVIGIVNCVIPSVGMFLMETAANTSFSRNISQTFKTRSHTVEDLKARRSDAQVELKDTLAKHQRIQMSLGDIAQVRMDIGNICERIGNIRGVLRFLKGIWESISDDAHEIVVWLTDDEFQDDDLISQPAIFVELSGRGKQYYEFLSVACREYADGLGNYSSGNRRVEVANYEQEADSSEHREDQDRVGSEDAEHDASYTDLASEVDELDVWREGLLEEYGGIEEEDNEAEENSSGPLSDVRVHEEQGLQEVSVDLDQGVTSSKVSKQNASNTPGGGKSDETDEDSQFVKDGTSDILAELAEGTDRKEDSGLGKNVSESEVDNEEEEVTEEPQSSEYLLDDLSDFWADQRRKIRGLLS